MLDRPDGEHGEGLEKHAGRHHGGLDRMRAQHGAAQQDHHPLARHVFAELRDVVRPDGFAESDFLSGSQQHAVPKGGGRKQARQIQHAGQYEPLRFGVPVVRAQRVVAVDERPVHEKTQHPKQEQLESSQQPSGPAFAFGRHTFARGIVECAGSIIVPPKERRHKVDSCPPTHAPTP